MLLFSDARGSVCLVSVFDAQGDRVSPWMWIFPDFLTTYSSVLLRSEVTIARLRLRLRFPPFPAIHTTVARATPSWLGRRMFWGVGHRMPRRPRSDSVGFSSTRTSKRANDRLSLSSRRSRNLRLPSRYFLAGRETQASGGGG